MPSISIVIPCFDHYKLTDGLLHDLQRNEEANITEIVVVDDGSVERETIAGLEYWQGQYDKLRVLHIPQNTGFTLAANAGLRWAIGDIKVLISNDVRIYAPFLNDVIALLIKKPNYLVGNLMQTGDTGWNAFVANGKKITFIYLEGYFLAARKQTWEALGYFDERYAPGDVEDIDLSTKAMNTPGFDIVALYSPGIVHLGAQTTGYNDARSEITKENKRKFEAKWLKR